MAELKYEVMKKVRTVFVVRRLAAPFMFLIAALAVIVSTVSVSHVIENMPKADIQAVMRFLAAAFAHTDVVVKGALVAGIAFLLMTLKGAVDSLRLSNSPERV